jgi:hypothetical protein
MYKYIVFQPWNGPPFNMEKSYLAVCLMALERLDCPDGHSSINALDTSVTVNGVTLAPYTCACGSYTIPSVRVAESVMDQSNVQYLAEMPIFENPIVLSTQLSIAVVVIVGKLGSILAQLLGLPSVFGFLLSGVAIQVQHDQIIYYIYDAITIFTGYSVSWFD